MVKVKKETKGSYSEVFKAIFSNEKDGGDKVDPLSAQNDAEVRITWQKARATWSNAMFYRTSKMLSRHARRTWVVCFWSTLPVKGMRTRWQRWWLTNLHPRDLYLLELPLAGSRDLRGLPAIDGHWVDWASPEATRWKGRQTVQCIQ